MSKRKTSVAERVVDRCRDLWWRRPIVTRNSTIMDRVVDARLAGYENGLKAAINGKRLTSTGRILHGIPGGAS